MMLAFSSAELIRVWERGAGQNPVDLALMLLAAANPERAMRDLAALSIGDRDAGLIALRESLFGPSLRSVAECPACGERLEFAIAASDLRSDTAGQPADGALELLAGDIHLRLRPPNSADLASIANCTDVSTARRLLAERCVMEARRSNEIVPTSDLPEQVVNEVAASVAAADPRADHLVHVRCAACGHGWELVLDIVSFLWREIDAAAQSLLRQVHELAWAYGWGEAEILAMGDARRRSYLAMVRP